jgi:hypothetical protein
MTLARQACLEDNLCHALSADNMLEGLGDESSITIRFIHAGF